MILNKACKFIDLSEAISIARKFMEAGIKSPDELQDWINKMDNKLDRLKDFNKLTKQEQELLKGLFKGVAFGGQYLNMPEAAALADHYYAGDGSPMTIDEALYLGGMDRATGEMLLGSDIVRKCRNKIKDHALDQVKKGNKSGETSTLDLLGGKKNKKLRDELNNTGKQTSGSMQRTAGYIESSGVLLSPQNNQRLMKANNQYSIKAEWRVEGNKVIIDYLIWDVYDFDTGSTTNIKISTAKLMSMKGIAMMAGIDISRFGSEISINIPDRLSKNMAAETGVNGPGHKFEYTTSWTDSIDIGSEESSGAGKGGSGTAEGGSGTEEISGWRKITSLFGS
ncbi:hypothetical protein ACFL6I_26735 [candidate division KSB1 bacterium]